MQDNQTDTFVDLVMPIGTLKVKVLPSRGPREPTCRGCGKLIRFAETPRGKHIPISKQEDGSWIAHFAICEKADEFSKKQNE